MLENTLGRARGQGRAEEDDFAEFLFALLAVQEGPERLFGRRLRRGMEAEETLVLFADHALE